MNEKLTGRQARAIAIILGARTITEGCEKAGINRQQFYAWMKSPIFKAEFDHQRRLIIDDALHLLKLSSEKAAKVLIDLLDSGREDIRLKTACAMLEYIGRFLEVEDIDERLSAIERRLDGANK